MAQVVKSQSVWNFEDLLRGTARSLNDDYSKYTDPEEVITDRLLKFLKKLPNMDLKEEIKRIMEGY